MYYWRVTKYNPCYRDNNGTYMHDEWTSFSDVGKYFSGKKLTIKEYLSIENAYINVVISALEESNIEYLEIKELERSDYTINDKYICPDAFKFYQELNENMHVSGESIELLGRLVLREQIWCKLESEILYIHFGYDYYMYISSKKHLDNTEKVIKESGLYIEDIKSPYYNS